MNFMTHSKAILLGAVLSTFGLAPVVSADDTEIFFGQSKDAFNTNPNILFILDTSGSMGYYDGGSQSRMDRMKVAMRVLLRESSSYNVGLMGFSGTNRGGSVHYPIGDLEADSGNLCPDGICPDERVVVRPVTQNDDATQNDDTNVVNLNAQALVMGDIDSAIDPATVPRAEEITDSVLAVAISAEYENADTDPTTRAIVGPSQWFYNGIVEPDKVQEDDRYAYRFEDIAIPEGSIVTAANITFTKTSEAAQVGNMSALIKLEATATPDPLPDGVNAFDTIESRLVNSTRGVQWNDIPPNTTLGGPTDTTLADTGGPAKPANAVVTPDLAEIMNLIVTLPTWEEGNPMSFILDPVDEYIPSKQDIREFYGIDVTENLRPVLTYSYAEAIDTDLTTIELEAVTHLDEITEQNTDTVSRNLTNKSSRLLFAADTHFPRKLAFRFDSIDIPNDAVIQTATLTLGGTSDAIEEPIANWEIDPTTLPVAADELSGGASGAASGATSGETTDEASDEVTTGGDTLPTDTTDLNVLSINVAAELSSNPAVYSQDPLSTRAITTNFEAWENIEITPDETISSPNLEKVVSAVINVDTWTSGSDLSLVLSAPDSYNNTAENSAFVHTATGDVKPKLSITWKAAEVSDSALKKTQTTAIRFPNVHVPPGATVKSAKLVFTADKASNEKTLFTISADNAGSSAPLTNALNDINGRTRTEKKTNWQAEEWEFPGEQYNSIDFSPVIQEVVTLSDWCGGNPMTIFIEKTGDQGSRHAVSREQNEIASPLLEITYEPGSVPPGAFCSNITFLSSVANGSDDAAEEIETNAIDLTSASLDAISPSSGKKQIIGLRFPGLGIPKDAAIVSATLNLTLEKDITTAQDYSFKIVNSLDNASFNNSDAKILDASRPTYPVSVTASALPGNAPDSSFMIDVAPLINAKVTDEDWVPGKPIVMTAEALGDIAQSFYSFDGAEARAPQLIIYYQSQRENPGTLFRDNLTTIVDSLKAQSGTPIVGSYFEASQYFLGESVDYGLQRGNRQSQDRFHRVSHPSSYINGEVERPSNCLESNLNASDCRYERIDSKNGLTPTYKSPIESECQQNHIVLLSDGQPTSNTAAAKVRNLTGVPNCADSGSFECGVELAEWLNTSDIDPVLDGVQNIKTHTIGFNLSTPQFMKDIAAKGGGGFYEADSSAELLNAFKNIFINVSKTDTSFVAPSATVSQSNRLKNREDIYYSLFKPAGTARWAGNLKRYKLGSVEDETANILDVNDALAIDDRTGRFFETAQSYWSDGVDGDSVLLGGAAEKLESNGISHLSRNVYTFTGSDPELSNGIYNDLLPENTNIDREWLKLPASLTENTDYVDQLLDWAHGKDEFDVDGDGDTDETRAQMGDPMHSQPLLLNYIGGKSVVHVATNEGFLHAIDHATGNENFAFIPKELLKNLRRNYENQPTRNRPYGLDGGMTSWIQDANNDGLIDPLKDKAYLYIGMRRGGNLYYALDVSDPAAPKYLWSIAGGADTSDALLTTANGDFTELGDTWSKPVKTKIFEEGATRDVLVFGAGYGSNQDPVDAPEPDVSAVIDPDEDNRQKRATDTVGRGFFIVDASTGEKLWHTTQMDYPEMLYSVPSDLRVIDINFDGMVDQIYFGDMGGQVWRFDYNNDTNPDLPTTIDSRMEGGTIAYFADTTPETARRFYYPPDVALLSIEGEQQLSISIGSGWRAHPLDDIVQDRFYNFRMKQVYGVPLDDDGGVRYPKVREGDTAMVNLEEVEIGREGTGSEIGWYLPLGKGEKVLSSSVTVDGEVVFTSYVPSLATDTCAAAIGSGSVFFMDAATGDPVKNLDGSDDSEEELGNTDRPPTPGMNLTSNDRYRPLSASGIPPQATVLFPELGKATAFAGRDKLEEVEIESLKTRTFWQEMVEENL